MLRIACCLETSFPADFSLPADDESVRVLDARSEIAVEQALRIREQCGAEITAFCLGGVAAERALRQALALGVDAAVQIHAEKLDWRREQILLAKSISHIISQTPFDLVLLSAETTDLNRCDAPAILSEILDLPLLPNVDQLDLVRESSPSPSSIIHHSSFLLHSWCRLQEQRALFECPLPAIVSVHPSLNVPRLPKLSQILAAKKMPVRVIEPLQDLGLSPDDPLLKPLERRVLAYAADQNPEHRIFDGSQADEIAGFAQSLRQRLEADCEDA